MTGALLNAATVLTLGLTGAKKLPVVDYLPAIIFAPLLARLLQLF